MPEVKYGGDSVDDWMSKNTETLSESRTVMDAAKIMTEKKIGSVIIIQKNFINKKNSKILGIVTETDIARRVIAQNKNPDKTKVGKIMTQNPIIIEYNSSIMQASHIITKNKIKRIPVTDHGILAGIFTITDLMASLVKLGKIYEVGELVKYIAKKKIGAKKFENIVRAEKWMASDIITCDKDKKVIDVAGLMDSYKVGDIVVTEGDQVIGIITDTDMVRKVCAGKLDPEKTRAEEIMSNPIISTDPETQLIDVAKIMHDQKIKRIVIMKKEKLQGLLSVTDLADALIQLNNFAQAHRIIDLLYEK